MTGCWEIKHKITQCELAVCLKKLDTLRCLLAACVLFSSNVWAEPVDKTNHQLLDDSEYRSGLEEVVVVGRQPQWRKPQQEPWRSERFELSADAIKVPRIQWFPEYNKDERDAYEGVRDRTGEKAEIKLFEWKF